MIKANDLCAKFEYVLSLGAGYIWGAAGQTWTEAKQRSATRAMTVKYGSKWIGKRVWDCSGMFSWSFSELGGYMYHGSNTIWRKYCTAKGKLKSGRRDDGQALRAGTAVFLTKDDNRHHIGLYIGDGYCIEAKGTAYGVVKSKITHWDEWGELSGVDYSEANITEENGVVYLETLKLGSQGEAVVTAQAYLNVWAISVGGIGIVEDGKFGTATKAAVMTFQNAQGLVVDGIVGTQTWAALQGLPEREADDPSEGANGGDLGDVDESALLTELEGLNKRQAVIIAALKGAM